MMNQAESIKILINSNMIGSSEARIFQQHFVALSQQIRAIELEESAEWNPKSCRSRAVIGFSSDSNFTSKSKYASSFRMLSLCDIYSSEHILSLESNFDAFMVYNENQKNILRYLTAKPILLQGEPSDPLFKVRDRSDLQKNNFDTCWFGYPESYNKSMTLVSHSIDQALKQNLIDKYRVITSKGQNINLRDQSKLIPFELNAISNLLNQFRYTILSHAPLDLHINTQNKSANKLISAVNSGSIPICSNTPEYSYLMKLMGFEDYMFRNQHDLKQIFTQLRANFSIDELRIESARLKLASYLQRSRQLSLQEFSSFFNQDLERVPDTIISEQEVKNLHQNMGVRYNIKQLLASIRLRFLR